MTQISSITLDQQIALRLLTLRTAREFSLAELAERSNVSKAMISRIERAQTSATAALLGRLAAGLGVSLTELLGDVDAPAQRLRKFADQAVWHDPKTGYCRRQVAERNQRNDIEMVEVLLPRRAAIAYPRWRETPYRQRLWLVEGKLQVDYGDERFVLAPGDRLDFDVDRAITFKALGQGACRYLLVIGSG